MADKVITFGASEGFGAFAGWEAINTEKTVKKSRATAPTDLGDTAASKLAGERTDVKSRYKCNNDTNTIPPDIGDLVNGYILEKIELKSVEQADGESCAEMVLLGHNHTANAHAASPALRKATHGITVTKAFGCQDFFGDSDGTNDSAIASSCVISIEHKDQNDGDGDHLVGENHNPTIAIETTYAGDHTFVATGYDLETPDIEVDENTGFLKSTAKGIKSLTVA